MTQFQDTVTGLIYTFINSYATPAEAKVAHPELPTTLSATVVPSPGSTYSWNGASWVLSMALQNEVLKVPAQTALTASDLVAIRCIKAGVIFPPTWQTYVTALRNIVNGTDTTSIVLPSQPPYPSGT